MEAALVIGLIKGILPKLVSLVEGKYKLQKGVKGDIEFLTNELGMIVAAIDVELSSQIEDHGASPVLDLSVKELRGLAHGIEDCIDGLMYHYAWERQPFLRRSVRRAPKSMRSQPQLATEMQRLRRAAEEAHQRRQRYTVTWRQPSPAAVCADESSSAQVFDPRILVDADLIGLDGPRAELLEQLAEAEGQPRQHKVVAIVGFCGMGKTALAAQVYNTETGDGRFEKHAWVCAAHKRPREVLEEMLRKLAPDAASSSTSDIDQLRADLKAQLVKKRYFIAIDDIRTKDLWRCMESAFPTNNDVASRILVTTTIDSIATACCFATRGYVHKMTRLDEKCSKQLFTKKACPGEYLSYPQPNSEAILKKCDGQPLALVAIGEFFRENGWPRTAACKDACNFLCCHLHTDEAFGALRRVLMRNYASLQGHDLRSCLLYFAMFPSDHPIRRKSLLRRWLAEGFIESQPSQGTSNPAAYFDRLMDRNIIRPVDVSNSDEVKTCQIYGMMREFILHMSVSQNFVTLLRDDNVDHQYVRRLSLHQITTADTGTFDSINLSLVRSLTVSGNTAEAVLDLRKYQLLRVLDLEKCNDLADDHLKGICTLLLLKYLSIGGKVTRLPKDIAKLKDLEVLDAKKLKVAVILPVEVFQLPCLIHLCGKFKLKPKCEVQDFLSVEKSKLETLAVLVTDGSQGYLHFISRMRKLRKVKFWCESSADAASNNWTDVQEAIQQFINDKKDANAGPRSLSLHLDKCSEGILNSLEGPCYLTSLKLHCNLDALPQFVIPLRGLVELCLSSVRLTTGLLEALTMLGDLKYLKLIADDLDEFIIKEQAQSATCMLCAATTGAPSNPRRVYAIPHHTSDGNNGCSTMQQTSTRIGRKEAAEEDDREWNGAASEIYIYSTSNSATQFT